MNGSEDLEDTRWMEVLAKANAMLALQGAKIENRLKQAEFLEGLGVTRPEAARMLGVSPTTLYTMAHKAKKGAARGKAKKHR